MSKTDKRIPDLTVDEFTTLMTDIIDQRIGTLFDPNGEPRDDFNEELLRRKNQSDLVGIE